MKICGWKDLKTAERYIRLAGVDERGATEGLDFIPNDQGVMDKVVNLYDYREANNNATLRPPGFAAFLRLAQKR